jgi:ATP sulfurylase
MARNGATIAPHGGMLVDRVLRGVLREAALERAASLKKVSLGPTSVSDLELIAVGAFSPLTGFMNKDDYESVVQDLRLNSGVVWSIPITLPVTREVADGLQEGEEIALLEGDRILGIMELTERFEYDKEREAELVYRTTEDAHPGVARLYRQGEVLLAGDIYLLERPADQQFPEFRHDPAQTRRMFAQRGWRRIVAFQTRNPIHRAHEAIQKTALEICDGLLLHPLVGETKADDIPAEVRMTSYQALLRDYYPPDRVVLGVFPAAMRYAGPREAILHALARKNYGCTHFIVGRDHAGVGGYYGTYDAQLIFDDFTREEIGVTPLFFEHMFYCRKCRGLVSVKTCPHSPEDHLVMSGTEVRARVGRGEMLPEEFTRPEVSKILVEGMRQRQEQTEAVQTRTDEQRKVLVIGLDCATPQLVFDQWRDKLPNLSKLMEGGTYGVLESTIPPITVPAWMSMVTSKDPGRLGFYGFRNRADYSYDKMRIANSSAVTEDTLWDILSRAGRRVAMVGVPQTYPVKPTNGNVITSFLTPSTQSQYTYPADLKGEIEGWVGEYMLDVDNFRTEDKDDLLRDIYEMTEKRFKVVGHMLREKEWDFFMLVEMGVDRIHHAFWKYFDPQHPKYEAGSRYENVIEEYYEYLDKEIGKILDAIDDDTVVLAVSDHGARHMEGGICINEWLRQEGYLTLKEEPTSIVPLEKVEIDWDRTKAWGAGGYYGRLFMNVEGREPQGVIPSGDYEEVRDEIIHKLSQITDENGVNIGTVSYKPQDVYSECRNVAPDLMIYFGNLAWRSVGSMGHGRVHTRENDIGPDDANHAQGGIFIMYDPRQQGQGKVEGLQLMDVAPTVLDVFGLPIPADMQGKRIGYRKE